MSVLPESSRASGEFYVVGGTLRRDAPSYLPRRADEDLYRGLTAGRFCYVLTSRQMGKSSLMVRTAARIREEGGIAAVLDLTEIGQNLSVDQWYKGLLNVIGEDLGFEEELAESWREHRDLGPMQRWMTAIRDVVLAGTTGPVVIFIDEIDAVRGLPFSTDEFFAGIRELYNKRTEHSDLGRLSFCLLGVASPSDLNRDTRTTPFNIGQRIELEDFSIDDAGPLAHGLGREMWQGDLLLGRVLYWTGGHPYLTQRLCQAIAGDETVLDEADVDRLCETLFLSPKARERDDNLLFVRERLLRSEVDLVGLLELYRDVLDGKRVTNDETNPLVTVLRLSGVVRVDEGALKVRNRIYKNVFNREWVATNLPGAEVRRQKRAFQSGLWRATVVGLAIVAVMSYLVLDAWRQRSRAEESRRVAEEQQDIAERERALNRRLLYVAHINLAYQAYARGDFPRAAELLQDEAPGIGIDDPRSFEFYYLWQLCHSELRTMPTGDSVVSLVYSPDGRTIAAGLVDGRLTFWESATGNSMREIQTGPSSVFAVAYSPDGTRLATGHSNGQLRIWDLKSGTSRTIDAHSSVLQSVAFSPDGSRIATAGGDNLVKVWPVGGDRPEVIFTGFTNWVGRVIFSPDGSELVAGSGNGIVKVWDLKRGAERATYDTHTAYVRAIAYSPDGATLVTGGGDGKLVFRPARGGGAPTIVNAYQEGVLSLAYSPDGLRLAVGSPAGLMGIWDAALYAEVAVFTGHVNEVSTIAYSPDGATIATGSFDGTVKLWDARNEPRMFTTLKGHSTNAYALSFSPDNRTLASASFDRTIALWDTQTEQRTGTLEGHSDQIRAVAYSPDGSRIASGCDDGTIRIWDARSGQTLHAIDGFTYWVSAVAFSPDGSKLGAASFDGSVKVWDVNTLAEPRSYRSDSGAIECFAFSPDGKLIAAGGADRSLYVWDTATGNLRATLTGHTDWINALAFSPDGKRLATAGSFLDATVRIWNVETLQTEHVLKGFGGTSGVAEQAVVGRLGRANALVFSPDGATLVVGTVDAKLKLLDVLSGQEYGSPVTGHTGRIYAVAFSPDGTILATASEDQTVRLLRAAPAEKVIADRAKSVAEGETHGFWGFF